MKRAYSRHPVPANPGLRARVRGAASTDASVRSLVPVPSPSDLHIEGHRQLRRIAHALAHDALRGIPLALGHLHDDFVVDLHEDARAQALGSEAVVDVE